MGAASFDDEALPGDNLAIRRYALCRCLAAWKRPLFQSHSVIGFAGGDAPGEELVISEEAGPEPNCVLTTATPALLLVLQT